MTLIGLIRTDLFSGGAERVFLIRGLAGQQGHHGAQAQLEQGVDTDHGGGGIPVFLDQFVQARAQLGIIGEQAGKAVGFIFRQWKSVFDYGSTTVDWEKMREKSMQIY